MSVQTEINRLNEAKAAIIAAIAAKGVVVVEGEKLDAMAEKIAQIVTGVVLPELGDTAAQPSDMRKGKTLYDDEGNPVTGNLTEISEGNEVYSGMANVEGNRGARYFKVKGPYANTYATDVILKPGAIISVVNVDAHKLGTATAADVLKGRTFTAASGLLAEGTKVINTETWTLTLEDGNTVEKVVHVE